MNIPSKMRNMVRTLLDRMGIDAYGRMRIREWLRRFDTEYVRQRAKALDFYRQFISNGDLVIDVGAHVGERTAIFRELGARVIAVEPQLECVEILRSRFSRDDRVIVLPVALGETEGEQPMFVADALTISSMSPDWIEAVKGSGRFSDHQWNAVRRVPVTTLDKLIEHYGRPSFVKIDVEGYEFNVMKGLTLVLDAVSLEFTPETREETIQCLSYLTAQGTYAFNYSSEESMTLAFPEWVDQDELIRTIRTISAPAWGDIYARGGRKSS